MARSAGGGDDDGATTPAGGLPQHPYVERLKPDPSRPAKRVVELVGLPGNSDRPGYQRLYLTTKLDYYAEFLASDMVHSEAVAADQSPFPGQEATQVSVDRDATIHYIWARSPQPVDEFDLDIRLGARAAGPAVAAAATPACPALISPLDGCQPLPTPPPCIIHTEATCPGHATCNTCPGQATCAAGATCAGHATCPNTQCNTCNTCPGQATCAAGATCAGHGTCQGTCATACQQMTCITCQGATCPQTCVG